MGFVECLTPCRRIARVPPSHLDQSPSCRLSGRPGTLPRSRAIFDRCRDWTVARTCVVLVRLSRRQWSAVIRSASRLSLMPSAAPAMVRREKRFYLTPYAWPHRLHGCWVGEGVGGGAVQKCSHSPIRTPPNAHCLPFPPWCALHAPSGGSSRTLAARLPASSPPLAKAHPWVLLCECGSPGCRPPPLPRLRSPAPPRLPTARSASMLVRHLYALLAPQCAPWPVSLADPPPYFP